MSAHNMPAELAQAAFLVNPDPLPGNTTVGAAGLGPTLYGAFRLVATQASTQEERTLPDPPRAGDFLGLTLFSTAGANLRVTASSKINTSGNTHILMTAADQNILLYSVPDASAIGKFRWNVVYNDGTSLS